MLIEVIRNGRLQGRIDDGRLISWTEEFKALWDDFQANPTDMVVFVAELEEQGYEADALEIDPFPFSGSPRPIAPIGKLSVVRDNRFEFRKQLGGGEEGFRLGFSPCPGTCGRIGEWATTEDAVIGNFPRSVDIGWPGRRWPTVDGGLRNRRRSRSSTTCRWRS